MKEAVINHEISVTGQIDASDLPKIASLGYKTVFCHRPDGEGEGQPAVQTIMDAANKLGINLVYLPVQSNNLNAEAVSDFAQAFDQAAKPVLAYCRSGKRAMTLWVLSQANEQTEAELKALAETAQYNYQLWHDAMNLTNHQLLRIKQQLKQEKSA